MRAAKWRVVALLLLLAGLAVELAEAEVVTPGGFTVATLREQLMFGLQAHARGAGIRRPSGDDGECEHLAARSSAEHVFMGPQETAV